MIRRLSSTLLKIVVYGAAPTILIISGYFTCLVVRDSLNQISKDCMQDEKINDIGVLQNVGLPVQKVGLPVQKVGIPADYLQLDFITDNHLVDKHLPLLTTNAEVIAETQRIQIQMFTRLIGKYKYAMLFDFAAFENKGDPAITVGELAIIRKLGLELVFSWAKIFEQKTIDHARNLSKEYSTEELVILLHGGGNLMAYISHDYDRKLVLESFPDFEVILFPQSILQTTTEKRTKQIQTWYSTHKRLTFLYRDRNSYNLGKKLFPEVRCYLMPDMAFQIGLIKRFMEPTHDILWLRRTDKESLNYQIPPESVNLDIVIDDWTQWITPKGTSQLEDPYLIVANGMIFLQRGRVVITDRLHGHILCVLLCIPHVVLDPLNNKITSYMQSWTSGLENILVAHSAEDALNKAVKLLRQLDDQIPKPFTMNSKKSVKSG